MTRPTAANAADVRPGGIFRALAVAIPFAVTVARAASSGEWRADLPAVRDLGLVSVGLGGAVSTVVAQLLSLLPLGSTAFRASLGSALALAAVSFVMFSLSHRALTVDERSPRLTSLLAAIAALTTSLSPTFQREATIGGGAMITVALALVVVELTTDSVALDEPGLLTGGAPRWVLIGAVIGALTAENALAALVTTIAVGFVVVVHRGTEFGVGRRWFNAVGRVLGRAPSKAPTGSPTRLFWPSRSTAWKTALACVGAALLLSAPLALRPLAPRASLDLGRALSTVRLSGLDAPAAHVGAIAAWTREMGPISLGIAVFGAVAALLSPRAREALAALVVFVMADVAAPASLGGALTTDPLSALRCLALASLAIASAIGVRAIATALYDVKRLPMMRTTAVLVVLFHVTIVALASEEAGFAADRSVQLAAEEWTDAALGSVAPRSAILVRTPELAWRLWAAKVTRGERPDVLIIPAPLLNRGRLAADLVAAERKTEPILLDIALSGEPSEFALSTLADVRPLHLQLNQAWNPRLTTHLTVGGMWLEYAAQPLGASDRAATNASGMSLLRRVVDAVRVPVLGDPPTQTIVAATLRDQAEVLTMLGEHDLALSFIEHVSSLAPGDAVAGSGWLREAMAEVGSIGKPRVDARATRAERRR